MPRKLAVALVLALLAISSGAPAQEPAVGVFLNPAIRPYREVLEGFKDSCRCTVTELPVPANGNGLTAESFKPGTTKLVLAIGMEAFEAAKAVPGVPVVALMVPEVGARIGERADWHGVDLSISPERHLAAMRRLFPEAKRIGVVYDPRTMGAYVREAGGAAQSLGFTLFTREIARPGEALAAIAGLKGAIDLFWMLPDPILTQPDLLNALLLFSFENRVPVYTFARKYVALGAVAALTIEPRDIGAQAGEMARAILADLADPTHPKKPAWEYAREHGLVVNRKVAGKIGLRFTEDALRGTTDVAE